MGWQRVGHDWATELNWTEDVGIGSLLFSDYFMVPLLLSFFPFALFLCDLMTFHRVFFDSFSLYHLCIYCRFFLCDYWARCCSVTQSCPTLCGPMDCSMPGFPVLHHLPELTQTSVHWVGDAIQPSHPLLSLHLWPSIFPSIRVFSNASTLCIRWPKYWSFSFSISPSNEYSGLISFRIDWFDLLAVFSSTIIRKHVFFGTQPSLWSNSHTHTWLLENLGHHKRGISTPTPRKCAHLNLLGLQHPPPTTLSCE